MIAALRIWMAAGQPVRTDEQKAALLAICHQCPSFRPSPSRCTECGCFVSATRTWLNKLHWATEACPLGKWDVDVTVTDSQMATERDRHRAAALELHRQRVMEWRARKGGQ